MTIEEFVRAMPLDFLLEAAAQEYIGSPVPTTVDELLSTWEGAVEGIAPPYSHLTQLVATDWVYGALGAIEEADRTWIPRHKLVFDLLKQAKEEYLQANVADDIESDAPWDVQGRIEFDTDNNSSWGEYWPSVVLWKWLEAAGCEYREETALE